MAKEKRPRDELDELLERVTLTEGQLDARLKELGKSRLRHRAELVMLPGLILVGGALLVGATCLGFVWYGIGKVWRHGWRSTETLAEGDDET